jgi:hypothetical protein
MSAAGLAEYYELPGPNIPVPCGYSVGHCDCQDAMLKPKKIDWLRVVLEGADGATIVRILLGYMQKVAEILAEGLDIRFGHVVDRVDWGQHGVHIKCEGGAVFQADAVIITVSLGVLKVTSVPLSACLPWRCIPWHKKCMTLCNVMAGEAQVHV